MELKNIHISYQVLNEDELTLEQLQLTKEATKAMAASYAPYSHFNVGSSILLEDGHIVRGSNQENASYPVGICAERAALAAASSIAHKKKIKAIAIIAKNSKNDIIPPVAPCGMCRQAILEAEMKHSQDIEILLCGLNGVVYIFKSIKDLLPLHFDGKQL